MLGVLMTSVTAPVMLTALPDIFRRIDVNPLHRQDRPVRAAAAAPMSGPPWSSRCGAAAS
jgi:hypothetical protein